MLKKSASGVLASLKRLSVREKSMLRCLSARLGTKRAVQAKLGMYLLTSSLAAALVGEMRVLARWDGRVRTTVFLNILDLEVSNGLRASG